MTQEKGPEFTPKRQKDAIVHREASKFDIEGICEFCGDRPAEFKNDEGIKLCGICIWR